MRWPDGVWLVSTHGQVVPGRCKATNLCDYCAKLAAVENTEMLALDACEGDAPQVWAVLTTRTATLDMARFYKARELVIRALRRRWPSCQYACLLEFTTGYSEWSQGQRRPHWNLLLKGIPAERVKLARKIIRRVWCGQVDATRGAQHVAPIGEAGGLMRYLALHFQKESQAPPAGFTGQRFNCSRGYFTGSTRAEARERAKLSLQHKRELHRVETEFGITGDEAEDMIDQHYAVVGLPEWALWKERRRRVPEADRTLAGIEHVPEPVLLGAFEWVEREAFLDELAGLRSRHRPAVGRLGGGGLPAVKVLRNVSASVAVCPLTRVAGDVGELGGDPEIPEPAPLDRLPF